MLSRYLKRNISKFRSRLKKKKKRIFRVNEQLVISIKIRQKFIFFKNITIFLVELKLKFLYLNERTLTKLFNGDTIYLFFLNVSFLRCTTIQLKRGIRFRIFDNSFIGICSAETLHIPRLHLAPGIGTRSLREEEFHGGITFQYTSGEQI